MQDSQATKSFIYPPIDKFDGEYAPFSNFYPAIITYRDFQFPTVEHAFVAAKSKDPIFWYKISKMPAKQAGKVKQMGRRIKLRDDWEWKKLTLMKNFIKQKFIQRPFRELLLSTHPRPLIEGNYWHDNFWGDCKCKKCKYTIGLNHLGELLMITRGSL